MEILHYIRSTHTDHASATPRRGQERTQVSHGVPARTIQTNSCTVLRHLVTVSDRHLLFMSVCVRQTTAPAVAESSK